MKKTVLKYMPMLAVLLSAISCTTEMDVPGGFDSDKVRVSLSVGIDDMSATRAEGDNYLDGEAYDTAKTNPEISDGTRATFLIYALYDEEGNIVPILDDDSKLVNRVAKEVTFPVKDITIDIERGKKYKMVFWAQNGNETENIYYDTSDLKAIQVYYNRDENGKGSNLNNDELRDAFCASVEIDGSSTEKHMTVVLHRPFAQINIGVSETAWKALQTSNVYIKKSEINVNHVAWKFNLFENSVVNPDDVGGDTQGFKSASLAANIIPYDMKINGEGSEEEKHKLKLTINNKQEEYYWLSMCYVLVGGNENTSSLVDVTDIKFHYASSENLDAEKATEILTPSFTKLDNVPVKRNWRTNILFDNDLTGTAKIHLDLNKNYNDDFNSTDWGETWNGRIANGVSVKSYRELPDVKTGQYGFWLDFNVSNAEGLKWIARRSNGTPFTEEDIPTWKTKDDELITYNEFMKDGKPDLDAYKEAVYKVIKGHALIARKIEDIKRLEEPWTFDDAAIILTNDIDFKGEVWKEPISTTYAKRKVPPTPGGYSPDMNNPFKGTFDGNGYTIKNVHLDCRQYASGEVMHEGAGLIGAASCRTVVKNLRLYNVEVTGDWNIGGIIGFYGHTNTDHLTLNNIQIENCKMHSIVGNNVNGDGNLGGLVGSLQGGGDKHEISDCRILNTTLYSSYLVGSLVGVLGNKGTKINDCTLSNVYMILSDYNDIGDYKDFNLNKRTNDPDHPEYALLFGNDLAKESAQNNLEMDGVTLTNVGLGIFAADNKRNTSGLDGIGSVQDVPLDIIPVLEARYGRGITLLSHITGTPSYSKEEDGTSDIDFGLYVDMTDIKDIQNSSREDKNLSFTIKGDWKGSTDGNAETQRDRLFTLNVKPGEHDTYGIGFIGSQNVQSYEPTAKVEDLIISGTPMIAGGIYLDNIKKVVLTNIAIYNVPTTIVDKNVPIGATLEVTNCDLRGETKYGAYESATFTNTAFYVGTGNSTERKDCKPGCATTFDRCHFRTGFDFDGTNLGSAKLTFKNCTYGEANAEELITADNVEEFLKISPELCTFDNTPQE